MATRQEFGASAKDLSGKQDDRCRSEPAGHPSRPAQNARHSLPTYRRDWTGKPDSAVTAPTHPPVGRLGVSPARSPARNTRLGSVTLPPASHAKPWPAVDGPITNSSAGFPANARRSNGNPTRIHTSEVNYGESIETSRAPLRLDPFANRTLAAIPSFDTGSAPLQPVSLEEISRLDGDKKIAIPQELRDEFQAIVQASSSSLLPFVKRVWSTLYTAETFVDGSPRRWLADHGTLEIRVARFRYGPRHQFLVAQGPLGSLWEGGKVVVIGQGSQTGSTCSKWKVWRGQKFDEQYTVCCVHNPSAVVEGRGRSIGEESATTDPIATSTPTISDLSEHRNRSGQMTNSPASARKRIVLRFTAGTKKRALNSFSSPSLDESVATQKRIRYGKANSDSTSTDRTTQLSPELGTSPIIQASQSASPRAAPTISPLTSPGNDDSVGSMSGLPTVPAAMWSLPPFEHGIAAIGSQDHTPALRQATFTPPPIVNNALIPPLPKEEEREVIEIEDDDHPSNEDPTFDVKNLKYVFVNSKDQVMDDYLYKSCGSIDLLFSAAEVAEIINSDTNKLTITVIGKKGRKDLNVGRGLAQHIDRIKRWVNELEAIEIRVARGKKVVFSD